MSDFEFERVVHAVMRDGSEIVRYDTAGKWYREFGDGLPRELLTVDVAAWCGKRAKTLHRDLYCGRIFNVLIRRSEEGIRR